MGGFQMFHGVRYTRSIFKNIMLIKNRNTIIMKQITISN